MRFVQLRRVYQAFFFGLFLALVLVTKPAVIGGFPVAWFLSIDPLVAVTTALATRSLYATLAWAIPLVVITLLFGRFFCGWLCPMGAMHHFIGWLGRPRKLRARIEKNLPRRAYALKYVVLFVMLGMAAAGSVQVGLLDPIAFTWRALATVILPGADNVAFGVYQGVRHFHASTLIAILFVAALLLNLVVPRLYCRLLCPLGALLGLLSRFSLFRIERRDALCSDCGACGADCAGAASPQATLRVAECMVCLSCTKGCPKKQVTYGLVRQTGISTTSIDVGRRRAIASLAGGIVAVPLLRASDGVEPRPNPECIRPPGALPEQEFLRRCIKCGACMKACPTGGLQPALQQAGLEGLWTPVLIARLGSCEHTCVLCGEVCPTGAIRKLSLTEKVGKPPAVDPMRIGTAFVDRGRCLPWAMDTDCIVCEEVCPTSPKAVYFKVEKVVTRDGGTRDLKRPYVDPNQCVGCGTCEARCPVHDRAAIRISSVGETRSRMNRFTLRGGRV